MYKYFDRMRDKFRPQELNNILILLVGILGLMLYLNSGFADSDFYWHATLGKTICSTGSIPKQDVFSWIAQENGFTETAHSWLSSIIIYLFTVICGGDIGGGVYCIVTAIIFDIIVYTLLIRKMKCILFQNIASICLAGITVTLFYSARPQSIGYSLFALAVYMLFKTWEKPTWKSVTILVGISVLQANFHGGTLPMIFAFEALFCIASVIPSWQFGNLRHNVQNKWHTFKIFAASLAASFLAGMLNPYGITLYWYFFITNNTVTKKYVTEWQPSTLFFSATIITLAIIFILFVILKGQRSFIKTLCIFAALFMAGLHMRVAYYAMIIAFIVLILEVDQLDLQISKQLPYVLFASLNAVCLAVVISYGLDGRLWADMNNPVPDELVEYLEEKSFSRPYTDYDDGGYLIAKGQKSFIDSRADLFSDEVLKDGLYLSAFAFEDASEYERCFAQYKFDAIILSRESCFKFMNYLYTQVNWKQDFCSEDWVVFIPTI